MNRHPFIAVILLASLAFQLMLAGIGSACAMPGSDSDGAARLMAMAGMRLDDAPQVAVDQPDTQSPTSGNQAPPCNESAPGAACHLMGPCTGSFVASPSTDGLEASATPARIARLEASSPPSRSTAPELPPPRA